MEHTSSGTATFPTDVLIVEDDPIIALDFEDTIIGFGVQTVRTAASVARALQMIAERPPDFALLDVGLVREKSFAVAERLAALKIPFVFVTGYAAEVKFLRPSRTRRGCQSPVRARRCRRHCSTGPALSQKNENGGFIWRVAAFAEGSPAACVGSATPRLHPVEFFVEILRLRPPRRHIPALDPKAADRC